MSTNTLQLQAVKTRGWRMGLGNMLSKELGHWFKTRRSNLSVTAGDCFANHVRNDGDSAMYSSGAKERTNRCGF